MADTAGSKLRRARMLRQLTLEDASRATKIRSIQLADLEEDEYSNFANLAYARGFLLAYGRYLHVDVAPYLEAFADASTFGLDDYQYLSETPLGVYRAPTRSWRRHTRKRGPREVLAMAAAAVLLAALVFSSYFYVSYRRLGDIDTLAERQEAHERTVPTEEGNTPAVNAPAPAIIPVSVTPLPAGPTVVPAEPAIAPLDGGPNVLAATLAVTSSNPKVGQLLTQLSLPAGKVTSAPDASTDAVSTLARMPVKNAVPKAQPVSNNSLE